MSSARLSATTTLLAAAVYVFALGTHAGHELESSVLEESPVNLHDLLVAIVVVVVNPVTVALAGLAAMHDASRAGGMRAAAGIAIVLLGPPLAAHGLKAGLGALDPLGGEGRRALGRAFFPSGHAAVAMTLGLIAIRAADPGRRRAIAVIAGTASGAYGSLVFASDNHHPLDVVGGALLAVAWAAALVAWLPELTPARGREGTTVSRAAPLCAALAIGGAGGLAVAGLAVAGLLPWRPLLLASAILVTLTTLGLALAFERALADTRLPLQR